MDTPQKKKFLNFRLTSAMALALIGGILLGVIFAFFSIGAIYILVPSALGGIALAVAIARTKSVPVAVCFSIVLAAFIIGAFYAYRICAVFAADSPFCGQEILIEGKVEKVGITSRGSIYLVLKDCRAGGVKTDGKIMAYLGENAGDYCEKGYYVSFYATLGQQSLFDGGEVSYAAQIGVKYFCSVGKGLDSQWGFSLFGTVNGAIRRALYGNADGETASVCFAMLTGDSSGISDGTLQSFRYGGIAHLFAVSGLHIGVIFGVLTLIFSGLPVNRYVSAAIRVAAIVFYAGVCNFTPSSVRAVVMCSVAVAAQLLYAKNDSLGALSLAAFILLLINPMYLFGVGFLLSFGAALGIIMLKCNIATVFGFLGKKTANAVSVALSAQLSAAPIQFAGFGYVSWAGLIANIFIIPIVSVMYIALFFCTAIAAAIPAAAPVLIHISTAPIEVFINAVVELGFENAIIVKQSGLWIYAPFVLILCAFTDKFNLKPVWRSTLGGVAAVCLCLGFAL